MKKNKVLAVVIACVAVIITALVITMAATGKFASLKKHFSDETAEKIILYTAVVLGIALSVGLFALLPTFLAGLLNKLIPLGR